MMTAFLRSGLVLMLVFWAGVAEAGTKEIAFTPCEDAALPHLAGSYCAKQTVPLVYGIEGSQGQASETLEIFIRKFPAAQKSKGQVWLIAGGPGEAGTSFYPSIERFQQAFPHYDIVIPDHRGTGYSSRICQKEESVNSPGGTALAGSEWASCFKALADNPDRTRAFSITHAAKDLSQVMGATKTSGKRYVYGVSYGTQLLVRFLKLKPKALRLDGVILDSLTPEETNLNYDLSHRSHYTNETGLSVLENCDKDEICHGNSTQALKDELADILKNQDQNPNLKISKSSNELKLTLASLLDYPASRNLLPRIINDLKVEKTDSLEKAKGLMRQDPLYTAAYPQGGSSIPLSAVISGSENNLRKTLTPKDVAEESKSFLFKSPLPEILAGGSGPFYAPDGLFGTPLKTDVPILVLQGTLDPKTPWVAAKERVTTWQKNSPLHLTWVTVKDAPHAIYWIAPNCFKASIEDFLNQRLQKTKTCTLDQRLLFNPSPLG